MNARKEALSAFIDIVEDGAYSNIRLKQLTCSENETAFICALVYTGLENLYLTDYILSKYVKRQKRVVRNILRLAVSELLFMDTPCYAAVNEYVNLCRLSGKKENCGLINAVLHAILLDKEHEKLPQLPENDIERLSITHSIPQYFIREWIDSYGYDQTLKILERCEPTSEIRVQWPESTENILNLFPESKRGKICADCILLPTGTLTPHHPLFLDGKITYQSEGAMAICQYLGDCKGKKILDACSAPGGKSAYLYSLTQGDVDLTCFEYHPHRTELMLETFKRLNVQAKVLTKDASQFDPNFAQSFDAVLIDAPCSGLGMIHSKPDLAIAKNGSDFSVLLETQKAILDTCSQYVRKNGILVYATCTISNKENTEMVADFISRHSGFILEEQKQLLPNIDSSGGFFMARLRCI